MGSIGLESMRLSQRAALAAVVAPLAPTLLFVLAQLAFAPLTLTWLLLLTRFLGHPRLSLPELSLPDPRYGYVLIGSAVAGYVLSYTLGMPAYLLLRRFRWSGWYAHLGSPFVTGAALVALALLWVTFRDPSWPFADIGFAYVGTYVYVSVYAVGFVIGVLMALTGLLFWLIARPDRSLQ